MASAAAAETENRQEYFVERTTRVERIQGRSGVWFRATVAPEYRNYGGVPLGGFLFALTLRALLAAHPNHPDPLTCGLEFIASPPVGSVVEIEVETMKEGRTFAFTTAKLFARSSGSLATATATDPAVHPSLSLCLHVTATLGHLHPLRNSPTFPDPRTLMNPSYAPRPLPTPDSPDCVDRAEELKKVRWAPFVDLFRMHEDREAVANAGTKRPLPDNSFNELLEGSSTWMSCKDGQPADVILAAMFADTPLLVGASPMPVKPSVPRNKLTYSTVTMTVDFHAPISSSNGPWLQTMQRDLHRRGELTIYEFLCWTREGELVLSARQQGWMRERRGRKGGQKL
ncbi:hypothetical protein M427DRAFT_68090 [Gonapodya prolifera JEL478]|uniref:Thioesterase/thiol ester dehydrase-isomerase n=1 Tax=Gonapodya prolifera (strain JEL478) TaxID=1344416 RepID=A0A139AMD2_GONPJ|nr:hypothetical protein M427DRAFT_68090 [Gonapodya prolifera JEL478]|eukprot:KXS17909.1 hypothetical protein M427DRAFT_68090 [Gonapodya prolifera JEL478]